VLVDVQGPQIGIEEQLVGHHVDGRLAASFVAHIPLRIDKAPEAWSCQKKRMQKDESPPLKRTHAQKVSKTVTGVGYGIFFISVGHTPYSQDLS